MYDPFDPTDPMRRASMPSMLDRTFRDIELQNKLFSVDHVTQFALEQQEKDRRRWAVQSDFSSQLIKASLLSISPQWMEANYTQAADAALKAEKFHLTDKLDIYRLPRETLTERLFVVQQNYWWLEQAHLQPFHHTSAFADFIFNESIVSNSIVDEFRRIRELAPPALSSIRQYGEFLDASGLSLRRWPQMRQLSAKEKKVRFERKLRSCRAPQRFRKAYDLIFQHETNLRDEIDFLMTVQYGEDWPERRLPLCGCDDLLAAWQEAASGNVLDWSTYRHLSKITTFRDHFDAVFSLGFESRRELKKLFADAGNLRGPTQHFRIYQFGPEEMLKLKGTWMLINRGFEILSPDHEVLDF